MVNVIKLRKGLDINLQGKAEQTKIGLKPAGLYALQPDDFTGVVPKVVVKEGEQVEAGQALFVDKNHPEILFVSPVSGKVKNAERCLPYRWRLRSSNSLWIMARTVPRT